MIQETSFATHLIVQWNEDSNTCKLSKSMYYITVRFTAVCQTYKVSVSRDNVIVRSSMTNKVFIDFAFSAVLLAVESFNTCRLQSFECSR